MTSAADSFTVLFDARANPVGAKRLEIVKGVPKAVAHAPGFYFFGVTAEVPGFADLEGFCNAMLDLPAGFIVRGEVIDGTPAPFPRRLHPRPNEPATLVDVARRWVGIDLDARPIPERLRSPRHAKAVAAQLIAELRRAAPELDDVRMWWAFSGSAFVPTDKPVASMRVVFLVKRALSSGQVKRWMRDVNARALQLGLSITDGKALLDESVANAVQPLYLARPIPVAVPDPLPGARRSGVAWGARERAVSASLVIEPPPPRIPTGRCVGASPKLEMPSATRLAGGDVGDQAARWRATPGGTLRQQIVGFIDATREGERDVSLFTLAVVLVPMLAHDDDAFAAVVAFVRDRVSLWISDGPRAWSDLATEKFKRVRINT